MVGTSKLVSANSDGTGSGNHSSSVPVLSANGKYVAFNSSASNLVNGDTNATSDVFVVNIGPHSAVRVDGNGDLVVTDNALGGKSDNLRISYDSGASTILIEDRHGDPIVAVVGSGSGTSLVRVNVADFAGGVIVNSGAGDDELTLDPSFVASGKQIQFDGGVGGNLLTVPLPVNPATISSDLQNIVTLVRGSTTNAPPPQVTMAVDSLNLAPVAAAVQSLAPNISGAFVDIVLHLADNDFSSQSLSVPSGIRLEIDGNATFAAGNAPGLTVQSGDVHLIGLTASSTVDASTILVTGGSLVVRNSSIRETSGGSRAAVDIVSGIVDLGTSGSSGGNTLNVSGPGQLVRNSTSQSVSAIGNVFQVDSTPLTDNFAIEDRIYHSVDAAGLGVVYWVDRNLYVPLSSGGTQRAIDAAVANDVVNVQFGISQVYNVGDKLLTVAF